MIRVLHILKYVAKIIMWRCCLQVVSYYINEIIPLLHTYSTDCHINTYTIANNQNITQLILLHQHYTQTHILSMHTVDNFYIDTIIALRLSHVTITVKTFPNGT